MCYIFLFTYSRMNKGRHSIRKRHVYLIMDDAGIHSINSLIIDSDIMNPYLMSYYILIVEAAYSVNLKNLVRKSQDNKNDYIHSKVRQAMRLLQYDNSYQVQSKLLQSSLTIDNWFARMMIHLKYGC